MLFWLGNNSGVFSVGNCYDVNWKCGNADSPLWEKLCKSKLHERLKIFIWRILADVIPPREKQNGHFNVGEISCGLCAAETERVLCTRLRTARALEPCRRWWIFVCCGLYRSYGEGFGYGVCCLLVVLFVEYEE